MVSQNSISSALSRLPTDETTALAVALIAKFHDRSDLKYHLSWTYGDFLEEIPRRVGTSEALDASVSTLVAAHSHLSSRTLISRTEALSKYNHALRTLRKALDVPWKACQTETLCACYLLLIAQSFIDTYRGCDPSGHTEGAAQMLKARGYFHTDDAFEQKLLLSLRGPVLMEALLVDKISFSHEEWLQLVENRFDLNTPEGRLMRCWAHMPDLMRRGKNALNGFEDVRLLAMEARREYQTLTMLLNGFKDRYDKYDASRYPASWAMRIYSHYQRIYGLGLAICLLSNCIAQGLDSCHADLEADSYDLCRQVLVLADQATAYRPLGSSYLSLCLIAAWCSCTEEAIRSKIEDVLLDYLQDFPRTIEPAAGMASLERTCRRLRLRDG